MGTPARTSIMLAIESALNTIATPTYKTDVATVETYIRESPIVGDGERPYLGFGFDREEYEHQSYHNMRIVAPWTVVGYLEEQTSWALASSAANDLIDDIIVAIMADDKLDGNATQTTLVSSESNEADPEFHRTAIVIVDFRTTYYRTTTAS